MHYGNVVASVLNGHENVAKNVTVIKQASCMQNIFYCFPFESEVKFGHFREIHHI